MAVQIQTIPELKVGTPAPLFQTTVVSLVGGLGTNAHYDVTADGQRFIIASGVSVTTNIPITVVLNWTAALKQ